jgi:hypothetical protein
MRAGIREREVHTKMDRSMERDLEHALRRVAAPDELWQRIDNGLNQPPSRRRRPPFGWAIAAGILAALGASWLAMAGKAPAPDSFAIAVFHQVCGHTERLELRTADLGELQRWAGKHAVEIRTAGPSAEDVEIAGAAPLRDRPGIVVAYRVNGLRSALLIEPSASQEAEQHANGFHRLESNGLSVSRWRGPATQQYTLVTEAGVTQAGQTADRACGLCHRETPGNRV